MKLTLILTVMGCFIYQPFANSRENRDFKSFFDQGHELRMEHIEKMHQLKLEQLERTTMKKKEDAQKIYALEQKLEPRNKEHNQQIREQIRDIRKSSRKNSKLEREPLLQAQKEYKEAMKRRRSAIKELGDQNVEPREERKKQTEI